MDENTDAFYMVYSPEGRAPTVRHERLSDARIEANRLAILNPGQDFIVLESLETRRATRPIEVVEHSHAVPF